MAKHEVIRIAPPDLNNILERIERLETLATLHGDSMLFIVETPNGNYLVAATSFEECMGRFPKQELIEYVGRATSRYSGFTIIRCWE